MWTWIIDLAHVAGSPSFLSEFLTWGDINTTISKTDFNDKHRQSTGTLEKTSSESVLMHSTLTPAVDLHHE